jgi:RNA polymerase sigma factor (TIGR02999 family)
MDGDSHCQRCGAELTGQALDGHCANCLLKLALEPPLFTTNHAPMNDVTQLLHSIGQGDGNAAAELLPLVYAELRRLAAHKMANEAAGHTLQPTALVHEAWLKIAGTDQRTWNGRQHFFAAAAEAMRRILIDRARRRQAAKRGAGVECLDADEADIPAPAADDQLLAVNEALAKFATFDARKAELVKLRYFVGLTFEETSEVLGIAVPTAKQWWAYARAWLRVEIAGSATGQPPGKM